MLRQEAFGLPVAGSQRLCVWRAPASGVLRARVVYVHPFAEEMNKSRHMAAEAARELAEHGFGVLEVDLYGCGDSAGDFGDATLEAWIEDVRAAIAWTSHVSDAPLWVWALRGGALVAGAVTQADAAVSGLLLWQPVLSGRTHLTQFLRLRHTADMLARGAAGSGTLKLRAELQRGAGLEIAGYHVSHALASGLDRTEFGCGRSVASIVWLEVGNVAPAVAGPAPFSQMVIAALRAQGARVVARSIGGPAFWQTVEIEFAPALVAATIELMTNETSHALARDSVPL